MVAHKKVPLSSIKSLTFYDAQLTCAGSACKSYTPSVVQCTNMGDDGMGGVQWRCDTDLPSALWMGKVDVSCEGWAKAGDLNVLQGSCGLTYDLHRVNKGLEYGEDPYIPSKTGKGFNLIFYLITSIILYSLLRSVIARFSPGNTPPSIASFFPGSDDGAGGGGRRGGGGGGGGSGPGFNGGPGGGGGGAPPPYTKTPQPQSSAQPQGQAQQGWAGPGFWTGLGAGALGTYLTTRARGDAPQQQHPPAGYGQGQPRMYNARRRMVDSFDDDDGNDFGYGRDRGVGSSGSAGLGEMRRATGFGGSSTR